MNYFLVLQWPTSSVTDYDSMVELEEKIEAGLTNGASVDGHDMGSGELNIFIDTDNPTQTFEEVKAVVGPLPLWADVRVAYRDAEGEDYTVLWPAGLSTFEVA